MAKHTRRNRRRKQLQTKLPELHSRKLHTEMVFSICYEQRLRKNRNGRFDPLVFGGESTNSEKHPITKSILRLLFPIKFGFVFSLNVCAMIFTFFDCPSEGHMGKKVKPKRRLKKIFFVFFCPVSIYLLSWDKNLLNHDFHRRRLREIKIFTSNGTALPTTR